MVAKTKPAAKGTAAFRAFEKKDMAMDKRMGVKEGSKRDQAMDKAGMKKAGVKPPKGFKG